MLYLISILFSLIFLYSHPSLYLIFALLLKLEEAIQKKAIKLQILAFISPFISQKIENSALHLETAALSVLKPLRSGKIKEHPYKCKEHTEPFAKFDLF